MIRQPVWLGVGFQAESGSGRNHLQFPGWPGMLRHCAPPPQAGIKQILHEATRATSARNNSEGPGMTPRSNLHPLEASAGAAVWADPSWTPGRTSGQGMGRPRSLRPGDTCKLAVSGRSQNRTRAGHWAAICGSARMVGQAGQRLSGHDCAAVTFTRLTRQLDTTAHRAD